MFKRLGLLLLAAVIGAFCLEVGERLSIPGAYGLVSPAEAVVGRPLDAGERRGRRAENRSTQLGGTHDC